MKIRPVLNSIAALSAIGVFYTFAFCMVDDVDDSEISKEYYYNTATEKPEETDSLPLMSEDIGMGTLGINMASDNLAGRGGYKTERADTPAKEDVADVSSKLDNEPGYEAQPDGETNGDGIVITPLTTEQTDPHREVTVTYVPAEAVNAENTAVSVDTAPAAYTAEPVEVDYNSIPEDIAGDMVISENRLQNSSEDYMNALTNFPSNREDVDDELIPSESDESAPAITFPETVVTTPQTDFSLWSDPAQTTGVVYSEGTYFETSFTTAAELPENTETAGKSLITYDPVTGAEIFTAKFDGKKQQVDAYKLICMILSTEMSPSFSQEALKAQSVAAYSYVKYHNVNGLVPTVLVKHDIPQEMSSAVSAVWGKCCYYNGAVAQTVYTASTAGSTARAVNVWGGKDVPYLQSIPTSFDITDDPNYGVTATYSESYIRQALESYFGITLSNSPENWLVVTERIDGSYVANVSVDGQKNVSGRKVRENILGFGIKSWAFDVSYSDGVFTFVTYGYGHGVGMSQNGANILAKQGYTYDQILALYFPGTTIA
ncbi:MAG: SpoIID/LytB domain-containing protein [Oscillospiraceae bacterium]|nr:SpoIID/LytB domain-containing protein [Oscillospiraceae bacterium]